MTNGGRRHKRNAEYRAQVESIDVLLVKSGIERRFVEAQLDAWLVQTIGVTESLWPGEMSPVTGVAFVAVGMAFLLSLQSRQGPVFRWSSCVLLLSVLILAMGVTAAMVPVIVLELLLSVYQHVGLARLLPAPAPWSKV